MTVIPFSTLLRERSRASHDTSEGASFIDDLVHGRSSQADYTALVAQHYFIYEALEAVAEQFRDDAVAQQFIDERLTRLPALEADLEFLIGADWREQIAPLPSTQRYVERIRSLDGWVGGFIAHHYTRYLGDLSGGQAIGRLMQRQFGFETNGVGFYLFNEIASPKKFKDTYREQLDAVDWDEQEKTRVVDEVLLAYRFNTEVFVDLDQARKSHVA